MKLEEPMSDQEFQEKMSLLIVESARRGMSMPQVVGDISFVLAELTYDFHDREKLIDIIRSCYDAMDTTPRSRT